jgi:hypothetical protein
MPGTRAQEFRNPYVAFTGFAKSGMPNRHIISLKEHVKKNSRLKGSTCTLIFHPKPVLPSKQTARFNPAETVRLQSGKTVFVLEMPSGDQHNKAFRIDLFSQSGAPLVDFIVEKEIPAGHDGQQPDGDPDALLSSRVVRIAYDKSRMATYEIDVMGLPRKSQLVSTGNGGKALAHGQLAYAIAEKVYWMLGMRSDACFAGDTVEELAAEAARKKGITIPKDVVSLLKERVEDAPELYYPASASNDGKVTFASTPKKRYINPRGDRWVTAQIDKIDYIFMNVCGTITAYLPHGEKRAREMEKLLARITPALASLGSENGARAPFMIGSQESAKDFILAREPDFVRVSEAYGSPGVLCSGVFVPIQAGNRMVKVGIEADSPGGGLVSYMDSPLPFASTQCEYRAVMPGGAFSLIFGQD